MTTLDRISDTVRDTIDVIADGWQDVWNKARAAITRFTPAADDKNVPAHGTRWGLLTAELHEDKKTVTVDLEAPGLGKEDFEIYVNGSKLLVRGRKSASAERTEGHYHITERAYGRFERLFALPAEVDDAGTTATYKHGVLSITMPKSEKEKPRIISIQ